MKSKIKYEWDDIQPVYNAIHELMKINDKNDIYTRFDKQMNRVDPVIFDVLLDFLIDNEYYLLADRFFENCANQNFDIHSQFNSESALDSFMTYFEAKQYTKVDYYLENGFDINDHVEWLLIFLDNAEFSELMNYIDLYNRKVKIDRIKSKIFS